MKEKLSVTVDRPLVKFLDSLPGHSRSDKLEQVLRRCKAASDDLALRRALAAYHDTDSDREEHEAWTRTMEHDQWNESAEAISGRSSSSATRNRGRR
jgi:hypothetical protein